MLCLRLKSWFLSLLVLCHTYLLTILTKYYPAIVRVRRLKCLKSAGRRRIELAGCLYSRVLVLALTAPLMSSATQAELLTYTKAQEVSGGEAFYCAKVSGKWTSLTLKGRRYTNDKLLLSKARTSYLRASGARRNTLRTTYQRASARYKARLDACRTSPLSLGWNLYPAPTARDIRAEGSGIQPITLQLEVLANKPDAEIECSIDSAPKTVNVQSLAGCRIIVSPTIYLTDGVKITWHATRKDKGGPVNSNQAGISLLWIQAPAGDNERLGVTDIVALNHPDYPVNNMFYGANNPLNFDESRMLMYELTNQDSSFGNGRLYVWGYISETECAANSPCLLNWTSSAEYAQAARPVPIINSQGRLRWKDLYWSPLETEPHVLYGIPYYDLYSVYRIDVDSNEISEVVSFIPADGTDVSGADCYGFTSRNTLWCSNASEDWSKGGFEVNVMDNSIAFVDADHPGAGSNTALDYCKAHEGNPLPAAYFGYPSWTSHGHGAISKNGIYQAVGYGTDPGVWYLPECTFYPDITREERYPHDFHWQIPTHAAWGNLQSGYFFGASANSYYDSSQRDGHNTAPWLRPVSLFQVFLDKQSGKIEQHHLTSFLTAGKWNETAPRVCDSSQDICAYNWTQSPLPWADKTGRKLFFTSTMGNYSIQDNQLKSVTPFSGASLYMASLAPVTEAGSCIDADNDGFGLNCVFGDDCDDSDFYVNPNAKEVFDGRDNNCNALIDCAEGASVQCLPKSLYVDTTSLGGACSDSRTRTTNARIRPFCTIQKASDLALAGDIVQIRSGTYNEKLRIRQGGTSPQHRIKFTSYQSEIVTIRPGRAFSTGWSSAGTGLYQRSFSGSGLELASLKAIATGAYGLLQADSLSHLQTATYASGQDLFYVDQTTGLVTLRLASRLPGTIYFVDQTDSILIQAPFVTFDDITVAYASRGFNVGFYGVWDLLSEHGHNFELTNSIVKHTFYEGVKSLQADISIRNNQFDYSGVPVKVRDGAVAIDFEANAMVLMGEGGLIEGNRTRHTSTALSNRYNSPGTGNAVRDFIIRNNHFTGRIVSSGINQLFYNNTVYTPDTVGFSLYYRARDQGIFNNVFHSPYGVRLSADGVSENVSFMNNIVNGTVSSRCLDLDLGATETFTLDRNIYFNCTSYKARGATIGGGFSGYMAYIGQFNQELNSFSADPRLDLNPEATLPFYPASNSPVINTAEDLSALFTSDSRGALRQPEMWDIGAFERP